MAQPPQSDHAEPGEAGAGLPAFLEGVARRYRSALNAYFRRRMGNQRQDSEDLTQEVFVRLARRGQPADIRNIEPYLFQAAAGVLTDYSRRRAVRHESGSLPYSDDDHAPADFSPERVLLGKEQAARALAAIEALPERARHAVLMFRFEGLKQAEIARRMGITLSAVEKHIRLGMIRISEALKDEE
ncbi:RNA polymerase sigma factor [Sphingosinicella rhizophila]|uniref:Sigma-70 family RNA polymerase sigma factor n=1 Tax=Sphingosinicella rhizophila TaxID=3050082 RepID=A0ABU3Q712_9SPHN|nr:sigma-70 family RNA polymerase sigma factor [Sphingosinicella sp. GR2756]MDT9599198.1 sigma-70 family RNA polymerase sigma factor [Sphingosinicella sp. GR2756]